MMFSLVGCNYAVSKSNNTFFLRIEIINGLQVIVFMWRL